MQGKRGWIYAEYSRILRSRIPSKLGMITIEQKQFDGTIRRIQYLLTYKPKEVDIDKLERATIKLLNKLKPYLIESYDPIGSTKVKQGNMSNTYRGRS